MTNHCWDLFKKESKVTGSIKCEGSGISNRRPVKTSVTIIPQGWNQNEKSLLLGFGKKKKKEKKIGNPAAARLIFQMSPRGFF